MGGIFMNNIHKKALSLALALVLAAGCSLMAFAQSSFEERLFFSSGDYDICYRVVPAQGGQVGRVFFLHGLLSSAIVWEELAAAFSEAGYLCAMMDLPGFGYSTREAPDVTPKDREALAAELMEALAPGEAWIVAGHSMGGGVALNIAAMYPEKVSSLLLYAPGSVGGSLHGSGLMRSLAEPLGAVLRFLVSPAINGDLLPRLIFGLANADLPYAMGYDIARVTAPLKESHTVQSALHMSYRAKPVDLGAAARLDLPILVLWAQWDYILSARRTRDIKAALASAEQQTVRGGHFFPERHAAEVFERSMAFLEG